MGNYDREHGFANTALTLMVNAGVPAIPDNFELFYLYAAGENPALVHAMRGPIESGKPITPDMIADLRLRCLSGARAAIAMDSVGQDMGSLIAVVMDRLQKANRDTANYKEALSVASGQLGAERSQADLRQLVGGLVAATRAMEQRTKSLEGELHATSQQVNDLRDKLDDVRRESMTDPLTQIANRKTFDEAVKSALGGVGEGEAVSLLICDIDHFKKFNDNWGHQTGDQVLRLVASCLSKNVKGRDTAVRYGGEEFAVLLRGTKLEEATQIAEQIRGTVQTKKLVKKSTGDVLGTITISIGVAQFRKGEGVETVVRRANACLYGAKHHGRNLVINQDDARRAELEPSAA